MLKIGLIREGKKPTDRRVPLTPRQAKELQEKHPDIQVVVQKSPFRCFQDTDYEEAGITVQDSVEACDILMGIKEVPPEQLIAGKTYLFFSHTIKQQPYNRPLLQEILRKNIRLIDYEKITDPEGKRLVAFGRWAGIVGAYNAILTWGKRYNLFDLRRAGSCFNLEDLKSEYSKVNLPPIKIILTGSGRVARGAMEVLDGIGIKKVSPEEILDKTFQEAVYAQLRSRDYHYRRKGGGFDAEEFYSHPALYDADFSKFTRVADILIASAYWHPEAPKLFSTEEAAKEDFRIKVVADITCDIGGSVPVSVRAGTITDPLYDFNPRTGKTETPLASEDNITVMAVDNLPCELPRDASESFGSQLMEHVIPFLTGEDSLGIIERATITKGGQLTPGFRYLQDYVDGK